MPSSSSTIKIVGAFGLDMDSSSHFFIFSTSYRFEHHAPRQASIACTRSGLQARDDYRRRLVDAYIVTLIDRHIKIAITWIDFRFKASDKPIGSAIPGDPDFLAWQAAAVGILKDDPDLRYCRRTGAFGYAADELIG